MSDCALCNRPLTRTNLRCKTCGSCEKCCRCPVGTPRFDERELGLVDGVKMEEIL